MKRFTFIFALLLATTTIMAEEFTLGKLKFKTLSDTEVELVGADNGITNFYLNSPITYQGKSYSVTSIGYEAFKGCSSLMSITIPESVTSIGEGATFQKCTSLKSVQWNAIHCKIDKNPDGSYYPPFANLKSIENFVFGNYVNFIPECLCFGLSGVTSITIPNSVTSIGEYAFSGCSSLMSITIPESVTSIGDRAFEGCTGLTSITIPNSVTSIGTSAFNGCSSLMSITIPESVTSIGEGATFQKCTSLKSVQWNAIHCKIDKNSNGSYYPPFYNLKSIENFVFGNYVTFIPESLCYGLSGVTSINIPNFVKSIGDGAFEGCSGLTSITIPESVTSIGDGAFAGCSSLTLVNIPSYTELNEGAFPEHTNVIKVGQKFTIGKLTYKTISSNEVALVEADQSITSAYITPTITYQGVTYSVTSIGGGAFAFCSSLTSITIPNSVTSIGDGAFAGCSALTSPVYNAHCFAYMPRSYKGDYTIKTGIKQIASAAFEGCKYLTSINIPNSVTSIGGGAFYNCIGLTSITIPNGVTHIGSFAFLGCSSLTSVTIPNSVTSIGFVAFYGCSSLTSMVVEEGNVMYDSRDNCNAIIYTATNTLITGCQNTIIPNSVTSIGYGAFMGCSGLTSITIPNSVTSIGGGAFYNCTGLTSITIPNSVTIIETSAFFGCSSLLFGIIPSHTKVNDGAFPEETQIIQGTQDLLEIINEFQVIRTMFDLQFLNYTRWHTE